MSVIGPFWTLFVSVLALLSDNVTLCGGCIASGVISAACDEYLDPEEVVDLVLLLDLPEWLRKMFRWLLAGVLE